jgi:hypothetical protein
MEIDEEKEALQKYSDRNTDTKHSLRDQLNDALQSKSDS